MESLNDVVAYWCDCVKAESALAQSFGVDKHKFTLHARSNGLLFEGGYDPFIFAKPGNEYHVRKGKIYDQLLRAHLKGQDIYFGYPLLMFFERGAKQNHVAPLLTIRVDVTIQQDSLYLSRSEQTPSLGACAFINLGLNPEEIVALNNQVTEIFADNNGLKLEVILYLIKNHTKLTFVEGIDPSNITSSSDAIIHPYDGTVVYNKAIFSLGDASAYNVHLLNDLEKLSGKKDISGSALNYIVTSGPAGQTELVPILPFQFDEYHVLAIKRIMGSPTSVITGPPGSGKSQFIANLIINLFLKRQRVLFVSHTSEAVQVVNQRINSEFANLVMQTGKKEIRQDLGRRLGELVELYNEQLTDAASGHNYGEIARNWADIRRETDYLRRTNALLKKLENNLRLYRKFSEAPGVLHNLALLLLQLQSNILVGIVDKRQASHEVLVKIDELRARHVDLSRSYVKENYLKIIFDSGLYGELAAFIDEVQNKKFNGMYASEKGDKYIRTALQVMNVWSCTLKSLAATFPLEADLFDYVIFDEASQIDLPSAAPALYRANRLVVVGDENQLNHIATINHATEAELAAKHGLAELMCYPGLVKYTDTSLFISAKKALREPELELKNHYRSNALIANLFNDVFYSGRLRIHEPVSNLPPEIKAGAFWLDIKGESYRHKAGSRYNSLEADYIVMLVEKLLPTAQPRKLTIGVATPYSKQETIIADKLTLKFGMNILSEVRVMTVYKFQGSEVDILLFSPVLAQKGDGGSDFWYIRNKQILNVAISRAKHVLLIVGDRNFALHSESKLKDIAEYCSRVGEEQGSSVPNRPMNIFERKLFELLRHLPDKGYRLEPQYVVGGRFTVDFALISKSKKIAIELDGRQHEIIGGLPVFEDKRRDDYLIRAGWEVRRIAVSKLLKAPDRIAEDVRQMLS